MASAIVIAYVGLGSNLGDRAAHIAAAVARLRGVGRVAAVSSLVETDAVGGPAGSPPFLNGVAVLATTRDADDLLQTLLAIEAELGRVRSVQWAPRTIDLDLLLYGDERIDRPRLTVPHPRMHERRFVLGPLAEVTPDLIHPALGVSVATLLARVDAR